MSDDVAFDILRRGDPAEIIRVALNARARAEEGVVCTCPEPILVGDDLMCGRCLLENDGQRLAREARMNGPHEFATHFPRGRDLTDKDREYWEQLGMCDVCSGWRDDPRHAGGGMSKQT